MRRKLSLMVVGLALLLTVGHANAQGFCVESWLSAILRGGFANIDGDFQTAVDAFTCALSRYPNDPIAYHGRGIAHAELGAWSAAVDDYSAMLEYAPDYAPGYFLRAEMDALLGLSENAAMDYDVAIDMDESLRAFIETNENYIEAYKNWGTIFLNQEGEYERAVEILTRLIELRPDADAYQRRGVAYERLLDYDSALADYLHSAELDPNFAYAYLGIGYIYGEQGDYEGAVAAYTDAIESDPTIAYAYRNRGINYENLGLLDEALADYATLVEIEPDYGWNWYRRGLVYIDLERAEAVDDLNRAIELDPGNPDFYFTRGRAYETLEDFPAAEADYRQAIALDPGFAYAYAGLGYAQFNQCRYGDALATYNQALAIDPDIWFVYTNMGYIATQQRDYRTALERYNQAMALEPDNEYNLEGRGVSYYHLGDYEAATRDYERAIEIAPESESAAGAYRGLAAIYVAQDRLDEAAGAYEQAYAIDPDEHDDLLWQARVQIKQANYEGALEAFDAYLAEVSDATSVYIERAGVYAELDDMDAALRDLDEVRQLGLSEHDPSIFYDARDRYAELDEPALAWGMEWQVIFADVVQDFFPEDDVDVYEPPPACRDEPLELAPDL